MIGGYIGCGGRLLLAIPYPSAVPANPPTRKGARKNLSPSAFTPSAGIPVVEKLLGIVV